MATNTPPISLYEDLLPKIVAVLELTQQSEGVTNPQAKQKLLQAVCALIFQYTLLRTNLIDERFQKYNLSSKRLCYQSTWWRAHHRRTRRRDQDAGNAQRAEAVGAMFILLRILIDKFEVLNWLNFLLGILHLEISFTMRIWKWTRWRPPRHDFRIEHFKADWVSLIASSGSLRRAIPFPNSQCGLGFNTSKIQKPIPHPISTWSPASWVPQVLLASQQIEERACTRSAQCVLHIPHLSLLLCWKGASDAQVERTVLLSVSGDGFPCKNGKPFRAAHKP